MYAKSGTGGQAAGAGGAEGGALPAGESVSGELTAVESAGYGELENLVKQAFKR